jgi:signal transduction histidine kinase
VVRDDGHGAQPPTSGTGFGLRSVQERLALVYGDDYSFSIERVGGYRVEIEIPAVVDGARAV